MNWLRISIKAFCNILQGERNIRTDGRTDRWTSSSTWRKQAV